MTTAQKNAKVKSNIIETLLSNLPEGSIQVGSAEFAIPTTVEGELRYAELKVTAKNNKATKVSPAYDPQAKREDWLAELGERERKAQERDERKAKKITADKAKRAAKE